MRGTVSRRGLLLLLLLTAVSWLVGAEAAGAVITDWAGDDYFESGNKGSGNRWYRGLNASSGIPVDWTVDVDGDGNIDDDQLSYYAFSLTDPLNPPSSLEHAHGRYLVEKPSAIFYGGIVARYGNTRSKYFTQATVEDELYVNKITLVAYMTEWDTGWEEPLVDDLAGYHAVFVWKKDGFLSGGDRVNVSFDQASIMSVQLVRNFDLWRGNGEMRWLVRQGDQCYLSENQLVKADKWDLEFNSIVPTETNWAPYSPVGPIDIDFDQEAAWFAPRDFTDVTAVGLYVERDVLSNDSDHLKLFDFHVEATLTIPSPTVAALSFWVGLWWGFLRAAHGA